MKVARPLNRTRSRKSEYGVRRGGRGAVARLGPGVFGERWRLSRAEEKVEAFKYCLVMYSLSCALDDFTPDTARRRGYLRHHRHLTQYSDKCLRGLICRTNIQLIGGGLVDARNDGNVAEYCHVPRSMPKCYGRVHLQHQPSMIHLVGPNFRGIRAAASLNDLKDPAAGD